MHREHMVQEAQSHAHYVFGWTEPCECYLPTYIEFILSVNERKAHTINSIRLSNYKHVIHLLFRNTFYLFIAFKRKKESVQCPVDKSYTKRDIKFLSILNWSACFVSWEQLSLVHPFVKCSWWSVKNLDKKKLKWESIKTNCYRWVQLALRSLKESTFVSFYLCALKCVQHHTSLFRCFFICAHCNKRWVRSPSNWWRARSARDHGKKKDIKERKRLLVTRQPPHQTTLWHTLLTDPIFFLSVRIADLWL